MNFRRFAVLGASLSLFAAACASPASDDASAASSQDMTDAWLEANIPPGSALESKVLGLVNDRTMVPGSFVSECGFTAAQASNIIAYRQGDDLSSSSDDQRFHTLQELDAIPFTDATFWANAVRCAMLHTPGPSVCVPGDHPPVIIELAVDESGSMSGDKWIATRDSILALLDKLHVANDPNTLIGMLAFDTQPGRKVSPRKMSAQHFADLSTMIDTPNPTGGSTGTEQALDAAFSAVERVPAASQPGARRIVVLLSDGLPNGGAAEQQRCVDLTTDAHARGVELYAVGIGAFPSPSVSSYDPAFMGQLAVAGGTAPASCAPDATDIASACHIQITPGAGVTELKSDLSAALESIRQDASASSGCP